MVTQVARIKSVQDDQPCMKDLTLWHSSNSEVWLGVFAFDNVTPAGASELNQFSSAILEVWSDGGGSTALLAATTVPYASFNATLTLAEWESKSDATIKFQLTDAQLTQEIKGTTTRFWYVVYLLSAAGRSIVAGGRLSLQSNQGDVGGVPPPPLALYYTRPEVDAMVSSLSAAESPYVVCDNESEVNNALLQGRWIVLRGEGNGGVINFTTMKEVTVPGTKVLGYGYKPAGGANQYAQVRYAFPTQKAFSATFADVLFWVKASNTEFAGFDILGLAALSPTISSCIGFYLPTTQEIDGLTIRNVNARNMRRFVAKDGFNGASILRRLRIEGCHITNLSNLGLYLRDSFYDCIIRDNIFECREQGASPTGYVWAQGMQLDADIRNCIIENNKVLRPERMGIELFSKAYAAPVFAPMLQNRIVRNTVQDAGSTGISVTYSTDSIIAENIVDGCGGCGIESSNGHAYLESTNRHSCKIAHNIVRNSYMPSSLSVGISIDQAFGDEVYGNRIEGIASGYTNADRDNQAAYAKGISVYRSRRTKIRGNTLSDVDGVGIFVQPAGYTAKEIEVIIENNDFRISSAMTKAQRSVWIQGALAVVRNNVSWVPTARAIYGGFYAQFQDGVPVYTGSDWSNPTYDGSFNESNLVVTYD